MSEYTQWLIVASFALAISGGFALGWLMGSKSMDKKWVRALRAHQCAKPFDHWLSP